jgi:hypothetical protein
MAGSLRLKRTGAGMVLALVGLLTGCGTSVKLAESRLPDALVEPYPLTVALRYGENIESFVYTETLPTGGDYRIDLGRASARMFDTTLADMFSGVVHLGPGAMPPEGIDLLVEPSLVALEFALPAQTVTKDYAVWIRYQIKVYDAEGQLQADYPLSAYGKAARESIMGGTESALRSATSLAIRDAAVLMLTGFERESRLAQRQLAGLAVAGQPAVSVGNDTPTKPEAPPAADPQPAENAEKFL